MVAPVLVRDVLDRLLAPVILEVHVDVRHLFALDVEEALEHQPVVQRVEVGDAEAVERQRRRCAAPHPEDDPLPPREVRDVPDHEEVVGVLRLRYDVQLVLQPLLRRVRRPVRVALAEALPAQLAQVGVRVFVIGGPVTRQAQRREIELHVRHIRYRLRVRHGLRQIGEQFQHLVGALQVVRRVGELEAVLVPDVGTRADAEQHVVDTGVALLNVVHVVRRDDGDVQLLPEPQQPVVQRSKEVEVLVPLHLQVEGGEHRLVPPGQLLRSLVVAVYQGNRYLGARAAREDDQAVGMLLQQIVVYARLVVEALQVCSGGQLHQVPVALIVLCEDREVVVVLALAARGAVRPLPVRNVQLAPDDRLDARFLASGVEVHHPVHRAVVGEAEGRHAQFFGTAHHRRYPAQAVEQAVLRVDVKMSERHRCNTPGQVGPL